MIQIEELTPFTETVDAQALLNEIEQYISAHAILPEGASTAITLWCLASYSIDSFRIFPKLTITSPEKRCGKSTVLELISTYASKALIFSNTSPAIIYRLIETHQPTLIIDEADTFIKGNNGDIVGIINSGHLRSSANVARCVGDNHSVGSFSTWTPMVLASIGTLQTTIMDRSVAIPLERKTLEQSVETNPHDIFDLKKETRQKLLKWSIDNKENIEANPIEPEDIGNSRMVDNWTPLFTIAKQVSDDYFEKCRSSYIALTTIEDEPQLSNILLSDIRKVYKSTQCDKISSEDLLTKLKVYEEHPWEEMNLSKHGMAKLLKLYKIKPKGIRLGGSTLRGYEIAQFTNAFESYLPQQ